MELMCCKTQILISWVCDGVYERSIAANLFREHALLPFPLFPFSPCHLIATYSISQKTHMYVLQCL